MDAAKKALDEETAINSSANSTADASAQIDANIDAINKQFTDMVEEIEVYLLIRRRMCV